MNAKEVVEAYLEDQDHELKWFNSPLHAAKTIRGWGYHHEGIMDKPTYDSNDSSFLDLYVYLVTGVISCGGRLCNPHMISC